MPIFAQSPEAINYQAVLRDASGTIISNQAVTLRTSLHADSTAGAIV